MSGAGAGCRCRRKTWRAYLSTQEKDGKPAINAKDRIGAGPWANAKGVVIASNLQELHTLTYKINKTTALTEKGEVVSGRGDTPNQHDTLTGSQQDGTVIPGTDDATVQQLDQQRGRTGRRVRRPHRSHRQWRRHQLLESLA